MMKNTTSTAICLFSVSLLFVGPLTNGQALGMGPKAENAKVDMYQLSPLAEKWFTQQSGPNDGVWVLKDNKALTILYYKGIKPRKVADHEHAPASTRLKFYSSGVNKWYMKSESAVGEVQVHILSPQIEQWVSNKAGQFRAVVVFRLDGSVVVFRPKTQGIHQISNTMVLVNQSQKLVQNVSVHRMPGEGEGAAFGCKESNGRWYWWP